jgi:hypothetical protein
MHFGQFWMSTMSSDFVVDLILIFLNFEHLYILELLDHAGA